MSTKRRQLAGVGITAALIAVFALTGCSASGAKDSSIFGNGAQPTAGTASGSGSSKSTPSAKPKTVDLTTIDPCALFPKTAAEQLVGTTLSDPNDAKDQSQPSCTYNPDPAGTMTAEATLNVGPGAENFYNIDHNIGHTFADVPGLGDEAHLERQGIFWRSGTVWFDINMLRLVDDDHEFDQPLTDAAKAVQAAYEQLQVTK